MILFTAFGAHSVCVSATLDVLTAPRHDGAPPAGADAGHDPGNDPGNRRRRGPRASRTAVYLLMLLTAGAYIPTPLYSDYQQMFGFSNLDLTILYAAFAMLSAPALLIFGSASDTHGPRPLLRLGVVLAAAGSMCFLFATGPGWLLAGRIAQGIALGAVTGAAAAVIVGAGAKHASLTASVAFVAGTAAGPLLAGSLATVIPGPFAMPYIAHLGLLTHAWYRVQKLPRRHESTGRWQPTWPVIPAGIRTAFATAAATGFLAWTVVGVFLALGPALLLGYGSGGAGNSAVAPDAVSPQSPGVVSRMALTHDTDSMLPALAAAMVAAVFGCSILTQLVSGRLAARSAQMVGASVLVTASGILVATGVSGSLTLLLTASVTAGIGHGFAYRGAAARVDAIAPPQRRGGVTAALYLAFYLGTGIPTIIVGVITIWYPLTHAVSLLAVAGAVIGVLTLVFTLVQNHGPENDRDRGDDGAQHPQHVPRCGSRREHTG